MRAHWSFAIAVLLVTGCQVAGDPGLPPGEVAVDLVFSDLGVKVVRVYPVEEFPITHFQAPAFLRYQLEDGDGEAVVAGILPDTRWAYSEARLGGGPVRFDSKFDQGYVSLRLPTVAGTIVLREPRPEGAVELGRVAFDPAAGAAASARIGSSSHALAEDDDVLGQPVTIYGSDQAPIKILVLPEGYTEAEMATFEMRALEMTSNLFATNDYADFKTAFRVQRQNVRSKESGLQGLDGDDIESAFELEIEDYNCPKFAGPRSWWGLGGSKAEDLARDLGKRAGATVTVVLINHEEGLTACVRDKLVVLTSDRDSGLTIAHELGHALFDLGDEYVAGGGTYGPVCKVLGWFGAHEKANITSDGESPPWWDLVTPGTPLPTPDEYTYHEAVGAFEGAQGCATSYFRPTHSCLMDASDQSDFCPVCRREMEKVMDALGYHHPPDNPSCPKKWRDDGVCDPCLGDDPDCGTIRCEVDHRCDMTVGEGCGTCPEDCGACVERGCGDGVCSDDETDTCEEDCGCRADYCQAEVAPFGCWCDAACQGRGDCCFDADLCTANPP